MKQNTRGTLLYIVPKMVEQVPVKMSKKVSKSHRRVVEKAIIAGNTDFVGKALRKNVKLRSMSDENGYTLLHFAAERSTETMVKLLLDQDLLPIKKTRCNQTALHLAVIASKYSVVKLLLDHGCSVHAIDDSHRTPLHYAVSNFCQRKSIARKRIILLLLRSGAKAVLPTFHGETPLLQAIEHRSEYLTQLFLGVEERPIVHLNSRSKNGETPLHFAVQRSCVGVVKMLINAGADVKSTTKEGKTALHLAVSSATRCEEIVRLLIERGSIINAKDNQGNTPILMAVHAIALARLAAPNVYHCCDNTIRSLLDAGADMNHTNNTGIPVFHEAIRTGQSCIINQFLGRGVDVRCRHLTLGYSSLHLAARYAPYDIINTLIDRGTPIEARTTREAMTPLHVAVQGGDKSHILTLLSRGADINALDYIGRTPLHYAALRSHPYVDILLDNGADPLIKAVTGDTPLDYVMRLLWNSTATIESLVRRLTFMEASGNRVASEVVNVGVRRHDKCREIYEKHRHEIERMKEQKIDEKISYFEVLSRDPIWLVTFVRRAEFQDALRYNEVLRMFPLYGKMANKKFNDAVHRRDLTETAIEHLLGMFSNVKLPILVVEKIVKYIQLEDLKKFVRSCESVCRIKGLRPSEQGRTFSWQLDEDALG